ncbi:hypothetical protein KUCAC02_036527, partial [Chaenocephalus aceratus]
EYGRSVTSSRWILASFPLICSQIGRNRKSFLSLISLDPRSTLPAGPSLHASCLLQDPRSTLPAGPSLHASCLLQDPRSIIQKLDFKLCYSSMRSDSLC